MERVNRAQASQAVAEIAVPIVVGLALGGVLVFTRRLSSEWQGLIILATITPIIALLFRDLNKLLLIALVVDIPIGLDVSLAKRAAESYPGSSGFVIAPMTVVLVVGYVLWIARRSPDRKHRVSVPKDIAIPALIYIFFMLVSAFQATQMWYSITELFLHIQFFLMYLYLINHAKDWSSLRVLTIALVTCLLLESVVMLAQYFTGFQMSTLGISTATNGSDIEGAAIRAAGTFSSANAAGTFLAVTLAIAFAACLGNNRLVNTRLAFIALLTGAAALATTQSRSALTAFGLSLVIVGVQAARRHLLLRTFLIFLVLAVLLAAGFSSQLAQRFTDSGEQSAQSRLWHASFALNVLEDHMFTGIGLNNTRFITDADEYLPLELIGKEFTRIHNKYLAIWVETGLFGFLAFVWLLLATARRAISGMLHAKDPYISIIMAGLLAALFAYSWHMSSAVFSERVRMQLLWLVLALITITAELVRRQNKASAPALEAQPAASVSMGPQTVDLSQP